MDTSDFHSVDPQDLSLGAIHHLLLSAVAPRPIAFASTVDHKGQVNLSPFSYFNVFSANPPVMIFSPARSGWDNTTKHTLDNVQMVPEVVVNIVDHAMIEQMSLASTEYPRGVNEFDKAGFTPAASKTVSPPRVMESPVSFECRVDRIIELGTEGGAGNLVICQVSYIHIKRQLLDDQKRLKPETLDQVARMGGNWYCRAHGEALFEVNKPGSDHGIGVDQLPESIRHSEILTGNNLGQLGGMPALPNLDQINEIRSRVEVMEILSTYGKPEKKLMALHKLAKNKLELKKVAQAAAILMLADQFMAEGQA